MTVPWLNYPLTMEALTGGGGDGGEAEINLLVLQKSKICFPGFHVPQHFLCLLVPLKSCTYLLCSPVSKNPWKASPTTNLHPILNPPLALMSSFFPSCSPIFFIFAGIILDGPNPFCEKVLLLFENGLYFWLGPI